MAVLGNVSGTPALDRTFVMLFCEKFSNIQKLHGFFSRLTSGKRLNPSLSSLWTQQPPPAFSPTFMKNIFHLISAAGAAEKSAEGSDCSSPNS
jgi:hypothetical protein